MRPDDEIAGREALEIELAPPTWMTLHHLAEFSTVAELLADARQRTPVFYETRVATGPDGLTAMWSGDAGYESGDPATPGVRHRLRIDAGPWQLERSV